MYGHDVSSLKTKNPHHKKKKKKVRYFNDDDSYSGDENPDYISFDGINVEIRESRLKYETSEFGAKKGNSNK